MKSLLTILTAVAFLVWAPFSFAAYNDVSLQDPAQITVGGVTLTVIGSNSVVEQLEVAPPSALTSFTATMPVSSYLRVQATGRYKINHSVSPSATYVLSETCNSTESSVEFQPLSGTTITVTVTPDLTNVCGSASVSGTSGTSGGGGAPASTPAPAPAPAPAPVAPPPVVPPPLVVVSAPSVPFTRTLQFGQSADEVKRLQQLLNSDPDTQIAFNGVGSPGNETAFYGALTKNAVGKFQLKYGIVAGEADPGFGVFGPKTRVKMNELLSAAPVAPTALSAAVEAQIMAIQVELVRLLTELIQQLQVR